MQVSVSGYARLGFGLCRFRVLQVLVSGYAGFGAGVPSLGSGVSGVGSGVWGGGSRSWLCDPSCRHMVRVWDSFSLQSRQLCARNPGCQLENGLDLAVCWAGKEELVFGFRDAQERAGTLYFRHPEIALTINAFHSSVCTRFPAL